jgi:hypothetical protein
VTSIFCGVFDVTIFDHVDVSVFHGTTLYVVFLIGQAFPAVDLLAWSSVEQLMGHASTAQHGDGFSCSEGFSSSGVCQFQAENLLFHARRR